MAMTRSHILGWTFLGIVLSASSASATEFQFNRHWLGQLRVVIVSRDLAAERFAEVPSLMESVLDDVNDTFTLQNLTYFDGSKAIDVTDESTRTILIPPTDFPGEATPATFHDSLTVNVLEWSNAPSYEDLPPKRLGYFGGESWSATLEEPSDIEPILVRLAGEYRANTESESTVQPFEVIIEVDSELPQFFFAGGDNYPSTLRFLAFPRFGDEAFKDVSFEFAGQSRLVTFVAQFKSVPAVPEPSTIALSLIFSAALWLARRR